MGICTLYFVRHGESEANAGIANQPDHEIILTATGQSQARQLVERLDVQPAAVYTSELLRTQQTASYYCHEHSIEPKVNRPEYFGDSEPPRVSRRPNFLREYPNEKYLFT